MTRKIKDLEGEKVGMLTAIESNHKEGVRGWNCQCECGEIIFVPTFTWGRKKSCGCVRKRNKQNLVGQRFGMLTVVELVGYTASRRLEYKCVCDCGEEVVSQIRYLQRGTRTHCGCQTAEVQSRANRLEWGISTRNRVLGTYKQNAKQKGFAFEISDEKAYELFSGNCYYCGEAPYKTLNIKKHYGSFTHNGIDRLDSLVGYQDDNVVSCCSNCNFLKSAIHHDEFLEMIKKIARNHNL